MATYSSILAWEIPCIEEPGGLQLIGSQRVGHDWSDLAFMHNLGPENKWVTIKTGISKVQIRLVAQSCPTLCDPMNRSMPGLPVHHQLPEFTQTHIHWVGDAIQPSHPLSSPSSPAFNLSPHQGLFQWVSSSHQVAKYWSFSFSISPYNEYSGLISFRMD